MISIIRFLTRTVANEGSNSPILKRPSCRTLQHMNKSYHVSESGAICVTRMYECKRNLKKNASLFQQALKDNGVLEKEEHIESVNFFCKYYRRVRTVFERR